MLIHIEPLGCGTILPAFVIGHAVEVDDDLDRIDASPGIVVIGQQAGGSCMQYPVLIGALVRLEPNRHRGLHDLDALVRGFRAMAEDPDLALLEREYPVLRSLVQTKGAQYSPAELLSLQRYLADDVTLPPLARASKRMWNSPQTTHAHASRSGPQCHVPCVGRTSVKARSAAAGIANTTSMNRISATSRSTISLRSTVRSDASSSASAGSCATRGPRNCSCSGKTRTDRGPRPSQTTVA